MDSEKFNSEQYESHLSSFGKKVLGNLMKILQERNECNKFLVRNRSNCGQKKCVISFGESHISPSSNLWQQNVFNNDIDNITVDNTGPRNIEPSIITSDRLLKSAAEHVLSRNVEEQCIETTQDAQFCQDTVRPLIHEGDMEIDSSLDHVQMARVHIEWDDIFDKQLLDDLSMLDTDSNVGTHKDISEFSGYNPVELNSAYEENLCNSKLSTKKKDMICDVNVNSDYENLVTAKVSSPYGTLNLHDDGPIEEQCLISHSAVRHNSEDLPNHSHLKSEIPKKVNMKKNKLKRQKSNNVIDVLPKKLKKSPVKSKNIYRKHKYTKAVKNWLDNVENEKFEDVMQLESNEEQKPETTHKQKNFVVQHVKKTIQAQLTNKGGVMKYGKPKSKDLSDKPNESSVLTKNNISNVGTVLKDKKTKTNFKPPIKCDIPVKDLSYTIICLNDVNFKENDIELSAIKGEDIDMILIFSNGFCQLNSHHTEDTCPVDGVMFKTNNVIYYWRGEYKIYRNTVEMLIKHNTIVCYDGKNLLKYFTSQHEFNVYSDNINVLDVQIGANLIDPDNAPENFTSVQKMVSYVPKYTIATECFKQKSAWYLSTLGECFVKLRAMLLDYELWKVFVQIEMRVLPIVAEMEQRGVRVDSERLKSMEDIILTRMKETERACHAAAGRVFQVNSTLQVRSILYEELQLDSKSSVRIRETVTKGAKSTSESMLRSLISLHPLPKRILEYRHLHKAHATFLAGISSQVKDGVVTPTWVQTAAVTGRIASNNPNLQAIPKAPFSLVLFPPDGKEEGNLSEPNQILNFRSVYVPREGRVLLAADFKHIECRVFAYAAADTSLLGALASPDLFRVLAAKWLNKSEQEVSSVDRERTKRMVYASLYGAGTRRLMDILGLGYDQTLSITASFNRTFPSLKSFGRGVVARCAQLGGRLATLCGRGRSFAHICSDDFALRSHAERQAVNFVVQGSAADLCKLAMVAAQQRLRGAAPPVRARLLLQIHDELVWEVEPEDLARAAAEIKSAMEGVGAACGMTVALPVAISAGTTWADMEDFTPTLLD